MRAYKAETIEGFDATIFATTHDEAATIFCVHHEAYMDRMPPDFTIGMIKRPRPGMQRRHMENALSGGLAGVGYYMQGRGWTIVPPELVMGFRESPPLSPIASIGDPSPFLEPDSNNAQPGRRTLPLMAFRVTSPEHRELFVFAEDSLAAAAIVTTWQLINGIANGTFTVDTEWWLTTDGLEQEHLLKALRWGTEGIGVYDPAAGWRIETPDDESDSKDGAVS